MEGAYNLAPGSSRCGTSSKQVSLIGKLNDCADRILHKWDQKALEWMKLSEIWFRSVS
jgi:hypothetical protein